ncbi:hypothetical protein EV174_001401 [Coemansia sp. RSA 2320]|nr:hypothetical protein EV174_001401 [Coemansia sp. RSA 2320]
MHPEDFMDDEDLADIQAARKIAVAGEYAAGTSSTVPGQLAKAEGASSGVVGDIAKRMAAEFGAIQARTSTRIGDIMMAKMGWKLGQGLGALTRVVDHHASSAPRRLPPKPVPLVACAPKTTMHGVGYGLEAGDLPANVDDEGSLVEPTLPALGALFKRSTTKPTTVALPSSSIETAKAKRKAAKTEKLKLSFDDDDDDDDDVSAGGALYRHSRDSESALATLARKPTKMASLTLPSSIAAHSADFCHDGRPPIDGFVLARSTEPEFRHYDGPVVPESFTGARSSSQSRWDSVPAVGSQSRISSHGDSLLVTANDRALLGIMETPGTAGQTLQPPQHIDTETAKAALAGRFEPYESDPAKQTRYVAFLEACASSSHNKLLHQEAGSACAATAEAIEFAKMAQVFRLSTVMSSRFTSGSAAADLSSSGPDSALKLSNNTPTSLKIDAIRTTLDWTPSRLLCKRMNVPPPAQTPVESSSKQQTANNKARRARAADFILWDRGPNDTLVPMVLANKPGDEPESSDPAQLQRPDLSLFKSIFGNDE